MEMLYESALAELDLTVRQFTVLEHVADLRSRDQFIIQSRLTAELAIDRTTISAICSRLFQRRPPLISMAAYREDGRSKIIDITPEGKSVVAKARVIIRRVDGEIRRMDGNALTPPALSVIDTLATNARHILREREGAGAS